MSACVDDNNKLRAINTKLKERVNELEKEVRFQPGRVVERRLQKS